MSKTSTNQAPSVEAASPEPVLTPLQRIKARQAEQRKNLAAKEKRPDPTGDKTSSGGGQATPKKMRSSASKQG